MSWFNPSVFVRHADLVAVTPRTRASRSLVRGSSRMCLPVQLQVFRLKTKLFELCPPVDLVHFLETFGTKCFEILLKLLPNRKCLRRHAPLARRDEVCRGQLIPERIGILVFL